jgi:hypothetical protein
VVTSRLNIREVVVAWSSGLKYIVLVKDGVTGRCGPRCDRSGAAKTTTDKEDESKPT